MARGHSLQLLRLGFVACVAALGATLLSACVSDEVVQLSSKVSELAADEVAPPTITAHPQDATVTTGQVLTLSVTASGGALRYQWKKNGNNIGENSNTFRIWSATASDAGSYAVVVLNSAGVVTSDSATVQVSTSGTGTTNGGTVGNGGNIGGGTGGFGGSGGSGGSGGTPVTAPTISTHPQGVTLTAGQALHLSVTASGGGTLSYQWKKNGVNVAGNSNSYQISNVATSDAGTYSVVVSNSAGSAISNNASVTVNTPVTLVTSCNQTHALPLVTHWSNSQNARSAGASDQFTLANPDLPSLMSNPASVKYLYAGNRLPLAGNYIGGNFSTQRYSDSDVQNWAQSVCQATNQAFRFWKPSVFDGSAAIDAVLTNAPQRSGVVLVVSGLTVSRSMYTVMLPANWSASGSEGRYPIVFNGFYDLNENLILHEGDDLAKLIARSAQSNGNGAIGVLWNGGGAIGSRTADPGAFDEFQQVIDAVARLGGDRHRLIGFGMSRGGLTALQMASNPNAHNYTIRYVHSGVPPAHLGTLARHVGATFPALMSAVEWSVGIAGAHKKNFVYPSVGNALTGLSATQAHCKIVTGDADPATLDNLHSLGSARFINALRSAGTQVFLELGSHDFIVPAFDTQWLYRQYVGESIPVELRMNYLAGHYVDTNARHLKLKAAMEVYTHSSGGAHPTVQSGQRNFFKIDQNSGSPVAISSSRFLFTMEIPRYLSPETIGHVVFTGEPGTSFEMTSSCYAGAPQTTAGTLNSWGYHAIEMDGGAYPAGTCNVTQVRIKHSGSSSWSNIPLDIRPYRMSSGESLAMDILGTHDPLLTGNDVYVSLQKGYLGENLEKVAGYGLNGVTYGIMESPN